MKETKQKEKSGTKLRPAAKVAIALIALVLILGLGIGILGTNLLNRLTRTDADDAYLPAETETPIASDEAPDMTPTPTRSPWATSWRGPSSPVAAPRP